MNDYIVTIASSERHDGEAPYDYLVNANSPDEASTKALAFFKADQEDDDAIVLSIHAGSIPPHVNDRRDTRGPAQ